MKELEPDDLREAVRVVAAGQALLSPGVTRSVIAEFSAKRDPRPKPPERLDLPPTGSARSSALVAEGLSDTEIGERLLMSPATAKTHVSRAMPELGAATAHSSS